jgi:hypothetical protein
MNSGLEKLVETYVRHVVRFSYSGPIYAPVRI